MSIEEAGPATSAPVAGKVPAARFSHVGINVIDMPVMEDFYVRVLGFTVTDRGEAVGLKLIFLSRDPAEHHQVVLGSGRPPNLPPNTMNPMFGPVINQLSFRVEGLGVLRQMDEHLTQCGVQNILRANHGIGWSLYFPDPEGNLLEFFADSPWYCEQPVMEPLDFSLSDERILEQTKGLCQQGRKFQSFAHWRAAIAREIQTRLP